MTRFLYSTLDVIQHATFWVSYQIHRLKTDGSDYPKWIVGTTEVAGVMRRLGEALPDALTVHRGVNEIEPYDFHVGSKWRLARIFRGPWLLGRLSSRRPAFIYLWAQGFMRNRTWEIRTLRRLGIIVVLMFLGSEIRSPYLQREFARDLGHDTLANYGWDWDPPEGSDAREEETLALARESVDSGAIILNAPIDQRSYLNEGEFTPYCGFYGLSERHFNFSEDKFNAPTRIRVVHAPSSPDTKGTAVVRATIRQLADEGYDFEYVELQGRSNAEVVRELFRSHICLNQFFCYLPGVLGVEAMAARTAVLMSADSSVERSLPTPETQAWLRTRTEDIYTNLKFLLDSPESMRRIANNGFRYASNNFRYEPSVSHLYSVIESGLTLEQRLPTTTLSSHPH